MSLFKLLLLLILIAIVVVIGVTAVFAFLGSRQGKTEQWARNAFTVSSGAVVILAVLIGSFASIRALNRIGSDGSEIVAPFATPSAVFDATGERVRTDAVAYTTPVPGTVIRQTPEPESITGVNYGSDYELTTCNDYVFLIEDTLVYAGPGNGHESIGSMSAGATVKRIGYNDHWSLIDYNNNYAFVPNDVLIITE